MGYPWVEQNVGKKGRERNGKDYRNYPQTHILHRILLFLSGCKPTWHIFFILGLHLEVNSFLKLSQVFFYIISYGRGMDQQLITNQLNIESFDLKPEPISSCTQFVEIIHGSSLKATSVVIQKILTCMCRLEIHLGMENHVLLRQ